MFDKNNRYITKRIQQEIPLELQLFMWDCIDTLKEQANNMDYLQVFEITNERVDEVFFQRIEHRQEVPEYSMTHRVFATEMANYKVFIIDDETHSTMLLAEEY
ncbi:MAG: DUF960 domain-containing protein [Clostridium sp.]|uniref:DUF960 domain-containing protein n=1 Tax=Clostridium sp. TaxID=1506 RepID=UPI003D6D068D